jgi:hypothetical protein
MEHLQRSMKAILNIRAALLITYNFYIIWQTSTSTHPNVYLEQTGVYQI